MVLELLRFCRGTVEFEFAGGYPERFISQCAKERIPLWQLRRRGTLLSARTTLRGGLRLRQAAAKAGVTVTVKRERGIPFLVRRYRLRTGLFAGLVVLALLPVVLSLFLWQITITGNEKIPTAQLREALAGLGVRKGVLRGSVDTLSVERRLMIGDDRLSWAAVNLRGSTARVEVVERDCPPQTLDITMPHNIVATHTGTILRMDIYEGQPAVQVGDSVLAGDILVSGILENGRQQNRTVHARAKVIAEISDSIAVTVPYRRTVYGYRGLVVRRSLPLGRWQLPLGKSTLPQPPWKLEAAKEPLTLWGLTLPVTVLRQNYILLEEATEEVTPEQAREEALAELARREAHDFAPGSVLRRETTGQELSDSFLLFGDYHRTADIAQEKMILTVLATPLLG
ncbi:MAG: sporulation protein YqfD [Angelakisella sp.]